MTTQQGVVNMVHKQNKFYYRLTQFLSGIVSRTLFRRKVLRNELKGKKGPLVVIANHEAALDFTNLIGLTKEQMIFVISNSFYNSLPFKKIMDKIGVIPKQQFQTCVKDMCAIKSAVEHGKILVIYPAGLMCEDGLSTPIPHTTYQFLKWIKADIYMARITGTYFVTPKWSKKNRPGRTYIDVFKLFDKSELENMELEEIVERTNGHLLFDAYRDQEENQVKYLGGDNVEGLENVLYVCPHCGKEETVRTSKNRIFCEACGYAEESDKYGFLHKVSEVGEEIRYVSDWSKKIYTDTLEKLRDGGELKISAHASFKAIDKDSGKFRDFGSGTVTLTREGFRIVGTVDGEDTDAYIAIDHFASLPFSPGKYFEIQHGHDILRCYTENPYDVIRTIHAIKALYELNPNNSPIAETHHHCG